MKDKKKYYQKYWSYYLSLVILLIGWILTYTYFFRFYEEAFFWIDKKEKLIVQLLFILNYYPTMLIRYLLRYFLLMTMSLLLILIIYIKNKKTVTNKRTVDSSMMLFLAIIGVFTFFFLKTVIWPLFLLVCLISLTTIYIVYVITKHLYDEADIKYGENEVIKKEGPFQTKELAINYSEEFSNYWTEYFENKGYFLVNSIQKKSEDEWYVESVIQSTNQE